MPSDDDILPGSPSTRWRDPVPEQKRMAREVKILIYSFTIAALIGAIIAIALKFWPTSHRLHIICLPVRYDSAHLLQLRDLPSMHVGVADATALQQFSPNETGGFTHDKYYSKEDITSSLSDALKKASTANPLVIYISALGRVDQGNAYLLPGDYSDDKPDNRIELKKFIEDIQDQQPGKDKLLLLDLASPTANVNGGTTKNDISTAVDTLLTKMSQDKTLKMHVLTSCSEGEISLPLWVERRSLFGYYLEKGLSGEAVVDRKINVKNLSDYMKDRVNYWAETCMGLNQQPKLYKPANTPDFDLRIHLDKPKNIIPTVAASTSPDVAAKESTEPTEKQKKEAADNKEAAILEQVQKQFYPPTIEKKWAERDQLLKSPDWTFFYPKLRLWERELLTTERYFQATADDRSDKTAALPNFQRPRLKTFYSLHQDTPFDSEDAEWTKTKLDIENYQGDSNAPLPSWVAQANIPGKALYITQRLWEKLIQPGKFSAETLKSYTKLLLEVVEVEQKANPSSNRSRPIELVLLQAVGKRTGIEAHKKFDDHAKNYRLILELAGNLEKEIYSHEKNPVAFSVCKDSLQKVDDDLKKAVIKQFNNPEWNSNDEQNADQLEKTKVALDEVTKRRKAEQQNYLTYWETVKLLHDSGEWVASSLDETQYAAWLYLAKTLNEKPQSIGDISNRDYIEALRQHPSQAKWTDRETTPAMLINELQCTLLKAGMRKMALRHMMVKLKEKHKEVIERDELLLKSTPPLQPRKASNHPESKQAEWREKIAGHLKSLIGTTDKRLTHSEQACIDATRELAEWMQTRLDAQNKWMNEVLKIKIDTPHETLYANASAACKKLADECQNRPKQQR